MSEKELQVSAIENGTVIDHIPPKNVFQVIRILNLENYNDLLLIGTNFDSKKFIKKGIVKISNKYFRSDQVNKVALVAPYATLIVIKNYKVVEKTTVKLPDKIEGLLKCVNPNCVTNHQNVMQQFTVISKEDVRLRCHYCEKITDKKNLSFK